MIEEQQKFIELVSGFVIGLTSDDLHRHYSVSGRFPTLTPSLIASSIASSAPKS